MGPFIYQSRKNGSVIYGFLGKRGLIVYLAALKKGAIRAAHPYHVIYRELPPRVLVAPCARLVFCRHLSILNVRCKLVNCEKTSQLRGPVDQNSV